MVSNAKDARRWLRNDLATGGLLDLSSSFEAHELAALETSLTLTNVGWVAATVTGQLEDAAVRRLIRDYCFDYVTLPTSNDRVVDAIGHAYGMVSLHENASNDARDGRAEGEMVGSCDAMLALFRSIRKVAMTYAPVFISGESGTGKELTAVAIHERSARRDQPFIAINCGAIPGHLLQSELFGYERGAFTDANQRKIGRVEAANGGTLFPDEIGDLPLESQASLLRFTVCACCKSMNCRCGHVAKTSNCSPSTCSTASRKTRAGVCAVSRPMRLPLSTTMAGRAMCAS